jgi:hypothetical protein
VEPEGKIMETATVTPETPQPDYAISVHPDMAHPLALPAETSTDKVNEFAGRVYDLWNRASTQAQAAASSLSENLGGPEISTAGLKSYWNNSVEAAKHPLQSAHEVISQTAHLPVQMANSQGQLLRDAYDSYKAGNHVDAVRKTLSYLTPVVGPMASKAGDQLQQGEYGKGVGTTLAAVLPMLFGAPEESPVTSVEESAANTARQYRPTISSTRPEVTPKPAPMLTDAEQAAVDFAAKQYGERAVRPSGVEEVTGRPEGKFTTEVNTPSLKRGA